MAKNSSDMELARRAEIFGLIANLVQEWKEHGGDPGDAFETFIQNQAKGHQILPRVVVRDDFVVCNHCSIDLSRRPMTLRLFKAFCSAPNFERSRDDMLREVYRLGSLDDCTPRFMEATYNNAVKLISRARILATLKLSYAVGHGVEWFVYDQERKIWCLYRMRNEYLSAKFGLNLSPNTLLN